MPEPTYQPNVPDILLEAPVPPKRSRSFYAALVLAAVVLAWSIHGAKIRPGELLDGIPQIFLTLGRMFPPDFSKITESKNYFLPETLSWRDLLLPLPTAGEQARARQRWWDNTFPQTVIGATLETVQMALAGTFLALLVAFPLGFLAARNTTPHRFVYYGVRSCLNLVRTIPDLALGLLFVTVSNKLLDEINQRIKPTLSLAVAIQEFGSNSDFLYSSLTGQRPENSQTAGNSRNDN